MCDIGDGDGDDADETEANYPTLWFFIIITNIIIFY